MNNQVGFTTSPTESRSSMYCTDVARMIQAPIFHVNGDDPEACIRVARLAFAFRQEFNKDVVIDIICYRRRGHNEGDDPSFTQPRMYDLIEKKRSTRKLYTEALIGRGDITVEDAEAVMIALPASGWRASSREVRDVQAPSDRRGRTRPGAGLSQQGGGQARHGDHHGDAEEDRGRAHHLPGRLHRAPQGDAAAAAPSRRDHPGPDRLGHRRDPGPRIAAARRPDRSAHRSGQPAGHLRPALRRRRGPGKTGESWVPLKHLDEDQGKFHVFDSLLSEFAAMGFEYGYSVASPEALVLWEAQFGDFANGAQTIIDEFITSGQAKWTQKSGVVLLLPHGYEGQGPDHSSGRIERWLQLAPRTRSRWPSRRPRPATSTCSGSRPSARCTGR